MLIQNGFQFCPSITKSPSDGRSSNVHIFKWNMTTLIVKKKYKVYLNILSYPTSYPGIMITINFKYKKFLIITYINFIFIQNMKIVSILFSLLIYEIIHCNNF